MEKENRKNYETAGRIHKKVLKQAVLWAKPDSSLLELATRVEDAVKTELESAGVSGGLAFPLNLSRNNEAAHATPRIADTTVLLATDLLKIDLGVQVDGFIADGAVSVNPSNDHARQIEANQHALEEALKMVVATKPISVIGNTVQPLAQKAGFAVIENLTGHGVGQFKQHAPPSVPNTINSIPTVFEDDMALAIEPFFSTGRGSIADSAQVEIFSIEETRSVRDPNARKILEFAQNEFATLPFAERQLAPLKLSDFARKIGLRELVKSKILHSYPVLVEQRGAFVSQAEKTVIIDGDEAIVIN